MIDTKLSIVSKEFLSEVEKTVDYEQTPLIKEETTGTTNTKNPNDLKVGEEPNTNVKRGSYLCEICDGLFYDKIDLKTHQKETHFLTLSNILACNLKHISM